MAGFNSSLKELANACGVTEMVTSLQSVTLSPRPLKEQGCTDRDDQRIAGTPIDQDDANLFEELSLDKMSAVNKGLLRGIYNNVSKVG